MKTRFLTAAMLALLLGASATGCKKAFEDNEESYDPNAGQETENKVNNSEENLDNVIEATIEESPDDYVFDLNTKNKIVGNKASVSVEGSGSEASGSEAKITKSGCYIIEGSLSDGRLTIDLDKEDKGIVKLILNGADYTSTTGAALKIKTCPKVSILLKDGTTNKLRSTTTADTSAAIQSSQSIYLSAESGKTGKLEVSSAKNHAIKTSDGIIIKSGNYVISSEQNDGIQAKDFIKIEDGNINITAYQHALKTTSTKENKGFVYISGGNMNLRSTQPATTDSGKDAIHAEGSINILGGKISLQSADDGISSGAHIVIKDGTLDIQKSDKCICAIGNITIDGGTMTLSPTAVKNGEESGSGHGITVKKTESNKRMGNVTINGGYIDITKCYEGVQGVKITINGGTLLINSMDDAINASEGGNSQPNGGGFGGRPPMGGPTGNPTSQQTGLYINGGFIMVTSTGDGIDSNGELIITNGTVLVSQNGRMNEAIDAGDGYEPTISGGVVIAAGSMGMASAPKASQTAFFASASGQAGKYLAINDPDGKNIMAWKVPQAYDVITVSAPELGTGQYTYSTDAAVSGTEHTKGTGFYYPATKATGNTASISLVQGKITATVHNGGPRF